jgi:hypothetical protein
MRRNKPYTGAYMMTLVLGFVGIVGVVSGVVPVVDGVSLPFGGVSVVVAFALLIGGGWVVLQRVQARHWRSAGRTAGLSATGDGRYPTFTGTVKGRSVRAAVCYEQRGDRGGRFTIVAAELNESATSGVVVSHTRDGGPELKPVSVADPDVTADPLVAAGQQALAGALVTGEGREALLAVDSCNQVYAGDAAPVVGRLAREEPQRNRTKVERFLRDRFRTFDWADDPETVAHVTSGPVLDGETLRQQIEAVATLTDSFDRTTPVE